MNDTWSCNGCHFCLLFICTWILWNTVSQGKKQMQALLYWCFFRNHKFNNNGLSFPGASFSFSYIILAPSIDFCYITFLLAFQNFPYHERNSVTEWKFILPHPQALSDSEILGILPVPREAFVNRIKKYHPLDNLFIFHNHNGLIKCCSIRWHFVSIPPPCAFDGQSQHKWNWGQRVGAKAAARGKSGPGCWSTL